MKMRNTWDTLSLVLAILAQVVIIGLAIWAIVVDIFWPNITLHPPPVPPTHGIPATIILPFLPLVVLPLMLFSLLIQWLRDEWHKWWNVTYGFELLIILLPIMLGILYTYGYLVIFGVL